MPSQQIGAACKLDDMTLAVAETERLDPRETFQRPRQAGRRILPAGEQYERGLAFGTCAFNSLSMT